MKLVDLLLGGLLISGFVWYATGYFGIAVAFFCFGMVIGIDLIALGKDPKDED